MRFINLLYIDEDEKEKPKTKGSRVNNERVAGSDENTGSPQEQEEIHSKIEAQKEEIKKYQSAWGSPGGAKRG